LLRSASTSFATRATVSSLSLLVAIAIACQGGAKSARAACHAMAQRLTAFESGGRFILAERRPERCPETDGPAACREKRPVVITPANAEHRPTIRPSSPWLTGLPPPSAAL